MNKRKDGKIVLSVGASGTGKTSIINYLIQTEKPQRLLIWDSDSQLSDTLHAEKIEENIKELGIRLIDERDSFKVGFVSGNLKDDFNKFCVLAFHLGKMKPLTVVVEELADVSTPAKASESWGILLRRGRKYGIETYATSQRIQEIDKTIIGNMAEFIVFKHVRPLDISQIKQITNDQFIPQKPMKFIHYLVNSEMKSRRGEISYRKGGSEPIIYYENKTEQA